MANEKRRQRRKLNAAKRKTNKDIKKRFHFKTETTSQQKN